MRKSKGAPAVSRPTEADSRTIHLATTLGVTASVVRAPLTRWNAGKPETVPGSRASLYSPGPLTRLSRSEVGDEKHHEQDDDQDQVGLLPVLLCHRILPGIRANKTLCLNGLAGSTATSSDCAAAGLSPILLPYPPPTQDIRSSGATVRGNNSTGPAGATSWRPGLGPPVCHSARNAESCGARRVTIHGIEPRKQLRNILLIICYCLL
jgi:hypothetical protein